jgi:hypothetical protein
MRSCLSRCGTTSGQRNWSCSANCCKNSHIALAPVSGLVWGYDKIKEFVATSVAKRLENVPREQIKTPLPQIAGPALEALKYTGHDQNLREMFAKLLATAMDEETAATAHPSFVEIIRQLSSDEAQICQLLKAQSDFPIINILAKIDSISEKSFVSNFSTLGYEASCKIPKMIQRYLENLDRLGLIRIRFDRWLTEKEAYKKLETHTDFLELIEKLKASGKNQKIEKGMIQCTNFGRLFLDACVD